jgi:hypothetical protein
MRLNIDELDLISDSREALKVVDKILDACLERYKDKLMTEPLDGVVNLRIKIDGMKELIGAYRQAVKNHR